MVSTYKTAVPVAFISKCGNLSVSKVTCIREIPGSNLGQETGFMIFLSQKNPGIISQIMPRRFPSTPLQFIVH
jgi:hypothetical protein